MQAPNVLKLKAHSHGGSPGQALHLAFPSALQPHIALDTTGNEPELYAVTGRGYLHAISLAGFQQPGQQMSLANAVTASISAGVHTIQHCAVCYSAVYACLSHQTDVWYET